MKYTDRLREYEKRKQFLYMTCASYEELEKEIKRLAKELKI